MLVSRMEMLLGQLTEDEVRALAWYLRRYLK